MTDSKIQHPAGTGEADRPNAPARRPPHDPLAEKHRSAHFEKNWRTVNYAKLNPQGEGGEPRPNRCRESDLMRADWNPSAAMSGKSGKAYPAKFATFVGGPFHAEVERLPAGNRPADRDDAD